MNPSIVHHNNYILISDLCLDKTEMYYAKTINIALKHDLSTITNG
jgi:hypothetical protein